MGEKPPQQKGGFADVAWILGAGSQAGLMLALPVLLALAAGYWLDRSLGTLPWITLVFTLIATIVGPIIVYRHVTQTVRRHLEPKKPGEER